MPYNTTHQKMEKEGLNEIPNTLYLAYCTKRIEFLDILKQQIQSDTLDPKDFLTFIELLKEDIVEREEIYETLLSTLKMYTETARAFEYRVIKHNQINGILWNPAAEKSSLIHEDDEDGEDGEEN